MPPLHPFHYLCHINPQKIMEQLRYFYHSDHASTELSTSLGSSSWITDGSGNAIQHLHYLPFGEDWVDQRNSSWNASYTFSGKEKDAETGYGYFGARYYDSGLSIWLSVDPMSDKYPSMSPYNYCANNPVILVDPDGRDFILTFKTVNGINYITISQTIYTGNQATHDNVKNAVNELKNTVKTIKIDNIDYIVEFDIKVEPPAVPTKQGYSVIMQSKENFDQNKTDGENFIVQLPIDGLQRNGSIYAGVTAAGCVITMYQIPSPLGNSNVDAINFYELIIHEIFHTMGQNDQFNGPYFDVDGRMYYCGTQNNGYDLNNISKKDVANIIRYAIDLINRTPDRTKGNGAAVKIINQPQTLTPTSVVTE